MRIRGPAVAWKLVYCIDCDHRYRLGFSRQARAINPTCPKCKRPNWSLRTKAESDALCLQWRPLVYHVLNRRRIPEVAGDCSDEVEAAAFLGLIMASRQWDAEYISPKTGKGVQFQSYAFNAISSWITRAIQAELKGGTLSRPVLSKGKLITVIPHLPIFEPTEDQYQAGINNVSDATDKRTKESIDNALDAERNTVLAEAMKQLFPRQRQIIELRFHRGLTLEQVGKAIGVTRERVRQIERQALARLRSLVSLDKLRPANE